MLNNNLITVPNPAEFIRRLEEHQLSKLESRERDKLEEKRKQRSEWELLTHSLANAILDKMIYRGQSACGFAVRDFLGRSGIHRRKDHISDYNGWTGLLEVALRNIRSINKWLLGDWVHDSRPFLRAPIKAGKVYNWDTSVAVRCIDDGPVRYYGFSDEQMAYYNKRRNTFMFTILRDVEKILKERGYKVENNIELKRWKDSKSTIYYDGSFRVWAD